MNTLTIGIYGKSYAECQSLLQILKNIETVRDSHFNIAIRNSESSFLWHRDIFDVVFLFLDIVTPESEQFIELFRKTAPFTHLVLISKSDSVFSLGYKFEANHCWKTPILYSNVLKEIDSLLAFDSLLSESYILHSSQKGIRKLYHRKLRYIETWNRQLIFHYNGEMINYLGCLADLEDRLPSNIFFRCNNSYLVNVFYVEEIIPDVHRYKIRLITGEEIPLSRNKKNDLVRLMTPKE